MPCLSNAQFAHLYNALVLWLYHEKKLFCLPVFIMCGTSPPLCMGVLALPPPRHLSKGHHTLNIKCQERYLISTESKGAGHFHSGTTNRPSATGSAGITSHPCWTTAPLLKMDGIICKGESWHHSPEDPPDAYGHWDTAAGLKAMKSAALCGHHLPLADAKMASGV